MKTKLGFLAILALFLAGCGSHATRSSGSYLGEITRHPERYIGTTISVFGTVISVDKTDEGTRFRIATVNYAYVFDVLYPGDVPKLVHDKDAYFLGKVAGTEKSTEAYSGVIVKVNAVAVRPVGVTKAVYLPQDRRIAQEWQKGSLELTETQTRVGAEAEEEMAPMAAAPTYASRAPSGAYPGLEGLAEPVQLAAGYQAAPPPQPTQVQISAEAPPAAYAEASARQAPMAPPAPPPAPVAYTPPPAPLPPPPAPAPVATPVATPPAAPSMVSNDQAEAADLRMINRNWNSLPEEVKAKIVHDIEQRTQTSDLNMIAKNWHDLPEDAKAAILKEIIESAR